ncbi:GNAT family N-acetyltransferase [Empedobacter falsenii]|uniref:GNAT family N-acetyltransferase n=1 Tax=Empedobacter falsenii TaxID=343874 RepID=UPI002576A358|nr:GNAT family N-acetyltransferase [Empedobacter falsenii]MDM1296889.1 GNAT family N-acetyltransferase [Empedobacter falsenii]MDM1316682.1 GNAT family N-acetyltransferase [Empedobacter falsenii]
MTTGLNLRQATIDDKNRIWEILEQAIQKRKEEGSDQWQDGYPNIDVVSNDIANGYGYVITDEKNNVIGYVAIINEIEPAYIEIEGKWLNDDPYIVIHRLASAQDVQIKGLGTWAMQEIEKVAKEKGVYSIKVDTNFDNIGMLRVFEKLGYQYCGEVYFRGGARKAFQKLIE